MSASAAGPEFGLLDANPGGSPAGHLRFEDEAGETYLEPFDLVETLAAVLVENGQRAHAYDNGWIEIGDDGLFAFPQLVDFTELDGGTIRTASTIQCNHPRLFPQGLFEYQHATGETFDDSVKRGFDQWARTDLLALLDATRAEPETCMTMRMEFGGEDGAPRRERRIVFGPVASFGRAQQAEAEARAPPLARPMANRRTRARPATMATRTASARAACSPTRWRRSARCSSSRACSPCACSLRATIRTANARPIAGSTARTGRRAWTACATTPRTGRARPGRRSNSASST
nr:hypothetical protein [Lysobacter enzymogenes]